jgi:alkanesulfonate monooxygenase SsuD/methylene tetrahydromethanopterin reductase-like flavin-dependent oxidoreductase (luciferase family)
MGPRDPASIAVWLMAGLSRGAQLGGRTTDTANPSNWSAGSIDTTAGVPRRRRRQSRMSRNSGKC